MEITFDPCKSNKNIVARGLSFERAVDFDWETAIYIEDDRITYPERRFIALGFLEQRLHVICFTPIKNGIRVISFRKSNSREIKRYEKEKIHQ
ncbi:MAG: BrnT family toxin [Gammaproteobacteria bacterium]